MHSLTHYTAGPCADAPGHGGAVQTNECQVPAGYAAARSGAVGLPTRTGLHRCGYLRSAGLRLVTRAPPGSVLVCRTHTDNDLRLLLGALGVFPGSSGRAP